MSKMTKTILSLAIVAIMSCGMVAVRAQEDTDVGNLINVGNIAENANLSDQSADTLIANTIKLVLGLLAVIALIIILIGGFKWMTSGGDSTKTGAAKKLMGAGIVGMLIILAAYVASNFIVQAITGVVGTNGGAE